MLRRIVLATLSLVLGGAVSAGLLVYAGSAGAGRAVYAAARDLPVGSPITGDAVIEVRAALDPGQAQETFGTAERHRLLGSLTVHQLSAGQLIQRSDVAAAAVADAPGSLVVVPLKFLPPARAGDRVDLFVLSGSGDGVSAAPFAWGVPVAAVQSDSLVLRVKSRQELAFVYAAGVLRLAAVVTAAPAPPDGAGPIASEEAAVAAAGG